jgi:hypothetical protein
LTPRRRVGNKVRQQGRTQIVRVADDLVDIVAVHGRPNGF